MGQDPEDEVHQVDEDPELGAEVVQEVPEVVPHLVADTRHLVEMHDPSNVRAGSPCPECACDVVRGMLGMLAET